jgi:hypothetical protein
MKMKNPNRLYEGSNAKYALTVRWIHNGGEE